MAHRCLIAAAVCLFAVVTLAGPTEKADSSSDESGESKEDSPHVCTHLNKTYALGEHIRTPDANCLHCTCTKRWKNVSSSDCAIIDCPFNYYRSRPHCKTTYVADQCCPELECSPARPGLETELLSGKKPHTSTDEMVITAAPGKEVTLYCIAETEDDKPLDSNLNHWVRKLPNGSEIPVELGKNVVSKFFPPKTWGLLLDELKEDSGGEYICHVATDPPQSHTATLKIHVRAASRSASCTGPTTVELSPGSHMCDDLPSNGYYYNETRFMCMEYEKRPCKKPVNYFSSRSECYGMCGDACYDQMKGGACEVREKRYYYDHTKDDCNTFTYNGCQGNRNNFETNEECENTCADVKFRLKDLEGRAKPAAHLEEELPPCQNVPCPWHQWLHYLWKGCKAITKPNACCPHRFECPSAEPAHAEGEQPTRPAARNFGTYHCAGQFADKFDLSVPHCLNCSCDADTKEFTCQGGNECLNADVDKKLRENCLPVYLENTCCPHSYYCPRAFKHPQHGPHEEFPEADELRCKYIGRTYPRGYELIVADDCMTCTCTTPPDFTCTRLTCPPHPSAVNETLRCKARLSPGRQCCPEYDCFDILEKPSDLDRPQTPKEKLVCETDPCDDYFTCLVNYTECHLGPCKRTCVHCATPMCSAGSYLKEIPFDCPTCAGYRTPEEACEVYRCPSEMECGVQEDKCRYEGICQPHCRLHIPEKIYIAIPLETVCEMPRCPPTCGFRTGSDGCRQCDCSIPRGPIKETPCIKECPQDCGQTVRLDGCLECECGPEPFFGDKPTPMPIPSSNEKCIKQCPQDCGRTVRENGCFECHCNVGPFFGNKPTPTPPQGAANTKIPCASVSCTFPCMAAPAEEDGCSKSCICPKTVEEACTKLECPKDSTCTAECGEGGSCTPVCQMQMRCPTALCQAGCTLEADDQGCKTICKCP